MNIFVVIEIDKKYHHFSLILFSQSLKLISNKNATHKWNQCFYIKKQHDCRRRIHWRNKQSSRLFFVRFFFFATNAVHNVILPYHQNIILHKIAFLFGGKKRWFFVQQLYIEDDCADDFLTQTNIWAHFFDDFLFITFFCHCGTKLNQKTFKRKHKMINCLSLKNNVNSFHYIDHHGIINVSYKV